MSDEKISTVGYIQHHLTNHAVGEGFWTFHLDTMVVSTLLGGLIIAVSIFLGRRLVIGVPGGLQNLAEILLEFVNKNIADAFPGHNPLIGPLALTIFLWVLLMNAMDLIPLDLFPVLAQWIAGDPGFYWKVVPTTDLNATLAIALAVFGLIIYYNFKIKGFVGYMKVFMFHPFGKFLVPFNIAMNIVEEVAKPLSLSLRLFGNIFAGELVFMLIALIGGTLAVGSLAAIAIWGPVHILLDFVWILFHLLIVTLQAFIFMVLTIVYLGMAHEEAH